MPDAPDTVPDRARRRAEVRARFEELQRTGDMGLRNALVEEHRWVAMHCVRRFADRGEPMSDLLQVAMLGVLKAVGRYDPDRGTTFSTFAVPTVTGELRRHFRDATWPVHVPRRVKELHLELSAVREALHHDLGRAPLVSEMADAMGVGEDEVLEGLEASAAYRSASLALPDDGEDGSEVERRIMGVDDEGIDLSEQRVDATGLLAGLSERERRILYLRFFEERSQSEIGEEVGLSQVHVSRILRATLDQLAKRSHT